ncbi:hypothetical protein AAV35_004485 [Salimicrobium jeotgali]|uniref:DUF1906 domain-containing protein n=4 Tax=Salimicrobium jeotgali TaxID=1230341 RepID=A0AAC9NNC2_9BACI|nr:hypothetical protein AAV35_004485 [Salimicrobium jeotgali]
MDEMVLLTQEWVNETYGNHPGYNTIDENGNTGWNTIHALTRALQIELGITNTADNFGAGTLARVRGITPISKNSNTNKNIVKIIQGALYCKGYGPGGVTGTYGSGTERAVTVLQRDMGEDNPSGSVDGKFFKALLSMDAYSLLYGGEESIRTVQQWMNKTYIHRKNFFYMPCDGLYSRNTQEALIYAIQYEEGLSDSIANGHFGPSTQSLLPTLQVGDADGTDNFVRLFQAAMRFNGYDVSFDGQFDANLSSKVKDFQSFTKLTVNGQADFQTWASLLVSTGDPSRDGSACDCITEITPARAETLRQHGYETVGRYLTNVPGGLNKKIQPGELENIFNAGLTVYPIYQTVGRDASYFNEEQGKEDAISAFKAAQDYGFKDGTIIYFAVDFDALGYQISGNIIPYFRSIKQSLNVLGYDYKVGVYGARNVCIQVSEAGHAVSSFVSGMSTGFSGNLGYPLPGNWAFNQISTITIGSGDGQIQIDNNIKSGRDNGASSVSSEVSNNDPSVHSVSSPFAEIQEIYSSESVDTISYSKAYDIKLGRIEGELTGQIIFGDASKGNWDLGVDKAINGDVMDGIINQFLNKMLEDGYLPSGVNEVTEARAEVDRIMDKIPNISEIRVDQLNPKLSSESPFFIMEYLVIEIMRKSAPSVYVKEKLALTDVDWDEDKLQKEAQIIILILILAYATSFAVSAAVIAALGKRLGQALARSMGMLSK